MNTNAILIAAVEAETAVRKAEPNVEAQLRAAMGAVRHHWLVTNEDQQIMAACEGTARVCTPEEKERLEAEIRFWQGLSAAASGVPVDIGALLPSEDEERPEPIGIAKLWRESVAPHPEAAGESDG